jgi:hypothetical protein
MATPQHPDPVVQPAWTSIPDADTAPGVPETSGDTTSAPEHDPGTALPHDVPTAWMSGPQQAAAVETDAVPERAQGPAPTTAPAITPPRWSGKKTAVAAALAIGLSSVGAVAAAATLPQGTGGAVDGRGGPGGGFGRQGRPPGQGQLPPGQGQLGTGTQRSQQGQGQLPQGSGTQLLPGQGQGVDPSNPTSANGTT